ncbi:hypothetical protein KR067_005632 [Drosophila pandora]|nr:hypothetical protein KR067_005632 [Drosophila pandora]
MSLTQLPVIPQAPGQPAFYPPDKIPKGAVIALMPVVILPQEYYSNCEENSVYQHSNIDPFPLGVQPASFSLHSVLTGSAPKDQCMCPCSCTQNLPGRLHKKRETSEADAPVAAKAEPEIKAEPIPAASEEVKVQVETKPVTPEEVKEKVVPAASEEVKVQVEPKPAASEEVKEKVEPVPAASEEVKAKIEPEEAKILADPKPEIKATSETN